jgi:hypothetical protein
MDRRRLRADFAESFLSDNPRPMTARTEVVIKRFNRWESQLSEALSLEGMEVGERD